MQSQLEQLEKDSSIEWQNVKLGDIFEFEAIKQAKSQSEIPTDNTADGIPYIVQSSFNNMFSRNVNKQWLIEHKEAPVTGNRIVLGVTLPAVSYQPREFGASQVITAKADWLNKQNGLFISTAISKLMYQFSYGNKPGMKIYKDMEIQLPTVTKNSKKQIAFDFIEKFIATLNAERIATLNAYLQTTGLKDYTLTVEEQTALDSLNKVVWGTFNIISLFSVKNTHCILSRDIIENSGNIPYLTAGQSNNSVSTYIKFDKSQIDEGNCVFIGGKTFVVTYQENDFFSNDSHNLALYYKDSDKRTQNNQLFMLTSIYKFLSPLYSWGDSISNKKIQKDKIQLPINQDKTPNYAYMSLVISAMQKVVIKNVVDYLDLRIEKTGEVVG